MKKITLLIMVTFFSALSYSQTVDCAVGPINNTGFCYGNNDTTSFTYTSSDGSPLAVIFNAGQVENNWDELIITDSDGTTQIYNGYGAGGDLTGLSFESTGDTITIGITSDGSVNCTGNGFTPWDFTISCVDTTQPPSCVAVTGPAGGSVDVNVESDITWGSATGGPTGYLVSIGTTPGGTDIANMVDAGLVNTYDPGTLPYSSDIFVTITPYNANGNSAGCTESMFTTEDDPNTPVDCAVGPVNNTGFCYGNNDNTMFNFASTDGSNLAVVFNAGQVENNWDELIILDSDGVTELYNGYGNAGDLTGLSFESSGSSIIVMIQSDGIFGCQSEGYTPWDFTVSCVDDSVPPTCVSLTSPTDGATDINEDDDINWGTATGAPTGYLVSIGTTPGGTDVANMVDVGLVNTYDPGTLDFSTTYYVTITPYNANGNATGCTEESFTIRDDPFEVVDCSAAPINNTGFCYTSGVTTRFSYRSSDGTSTLAVSFNAGQVENNWDELNIYDSDGVTLLYSGYGNAGDLAGLAFESTGDSIIIEVTPDGSISCQTQGYTPWDFIVGCIDPLAPPSCVSLTFPTNGATAVEIDQNITWGSAIGSPAGYILTVGTTPGGNDIVNGEDVGLVNTYALDTDYSTTYYVTILPYNGNGLATGCIEESFTTRPDPNQVFNLVCADGPINVSHCYTNNDDNTFLFTSDTGFPVRLSFLTGTIVDDFDTITIYDGSDATAPVLFDGNNAGDLTGLIVESSGGNIFMVINSGGFTSCASGNGTTWDWTAECLTCFKPTATYTVVEDCAAGEQFLVDVEILATGDAMSITISDDFGSAPQVVTAAGVYTFGPYPNTTPVVFTVADTDDTNCVLTSEPQTQAFCPDQACRIINAGYDQLQTCDVTSTDLSATFMASSITSDTSTYTISDLQCPPDNLTGLPTSITLDDRWSSVINLDFNFQYFGNDYNSVIIGANGLLSFDIADAGNFCPWNINAADLLPSPNLPLNAVHGAYHDIDPGVAGDHYIEYTTVGTAPSRQFKVTFFRIPQFGCNELLTTQQIILYESSNVVDVLLIEKPLCTTWNGGLATTGIQNITGTVGYAPTGRNTGAWEVTEQELWRFVPDGNPNYTFEWLDEDGNVISNDTDITVSPTDDATYTASITYALADGSLVTLTDDVTVTVQKNPEVGPAGPIEVCDEDLDGSTDFDLTSVETDLLLPNDPADPITVTYYDSMADAEAGNNMLADPTVYTSAGGTVYVRLQNDDTGCYATGSFEVVVLMQIDPANIALEGECINDEYTITVSPLNNGYDPATVTYDWSGGSSSANDGSQFIATDDGEYTVTITTADGCSSSQTFTVINSMCSFPQGISPNGDNLNDTWDLRAFRVQELEIFNSHGRSVYQKNQYANEWRGQTNDNDELPVGTYFYVLRLENGQAKNGWIYLNK
ncbi:gliding motility-associated C-terminal domain-containing protein [uncultured Kordia sp.]|uniref:gliding motility-associated C-terminal domain-containing protein n=1 Tax=uncultured Kordia sp. TaxID=507699 RepID=UPI002608BE74|nr:gliding motility-associated C-terminal domain-containing protein [uncultured Kordia sp.]